MLIVPEQTPRINAHVAMSVLVGVGVRMGMNFPGWMPMTMGVNQVGPAKQRAVAQQRPWIALGCDLAFLKDDAMVSDVFDQPQFVSGRDHGFVPVAQGDQHIDDLALAAWIEPRGRLVQQQDFRVEHQHRCQSDPLLLAAREPVRWPPLQVSDFHLIERLGNPPDDFLAGHAELQRPERDLIEYRRIEELNVRILKNKSNPAAKIEGEPIMIESVAVERLAVE